MVIQEITTIENISLSLIFSSKAKTAIQIAQANSIITNFFFLKQHIDMPDQFDSFSHSPSKKHIFAMIRP